MSKSKSPRSPTRVKAKDLEPQSDDWYVARMEGTPLITEKSRQTYRVNIGGALRVTGAPSIHELLTSPQKYVPILEKAVANENTRVSYYIAIVKFMSAGSIKWEDKPTYNAWYGAMMQVRKQRNERLNRNEPTERQKETDYSWAQIQKVLASYPKESPEHLLLAMYVLIPPRRQQDYAALRVYTDPKEIPLLDHNHMHLAHPKHGPYMYLNDFKTVKMMGPFFNKEIPAELVNVIRLSLKKQPRDYLFETPKGVPYSSGPTFAAYSNGVLKKMFRNPKMSVNALRHAHATELNNRPGVTFAERSRTARKMGHGINDNLQYAFVPSPAEDKMQMPNGKSSLTNPTAVADEYYRLNRETGKLEKVEWPPRKEASIPAPPAPEEITVCYRLNEETGKLEPFRCPTKEEIANASLRKQQLAKVGVAHRV